MGCESMRQHIKDRLGIDYGETSSDGEFTLIPVPCLGDCDRAPVMMVDDHQHRNLTREKIDAIIQRYLNNETGEQSSQE
jgi:NADH-quinone oxidoreductase subunit E